MYETLAQAEGCGLAAPQIGKAIRLFIVDGTELAEDYEIYYPAKDGNNLNLTIDVVLQQYLEKNLEIAYRDNKVAEHASGIVIDVKTGEMLAMATYPTFDLNDPRKLNEYDEATLAASGFSADSEEYAKLKQELQLTTWSNKAVTEVYMPGSTFKIVTASMAYEENLINDSETFYCPGHHYPLPGSKIKIHCHKTKGHGPLTFTGGIQQSCNPVLMTIAGRVGTEKFYDYFENINEDIKEVFGVSNTWRFGAEVKLGTVAILSFTSLTNTIKKNKIREQEVFTTNVINAAKLYMTSHLDDFPNIDDNNFNAVITSRKLIEHKYLKENIGNPNDTNIYLYYI